jgi:catechol 2,3-dioxygenase-like lactoylglutathione lyase family enzyme
MTQQTPTLTLAGYVLDSPDPSKLASFYARLLGWTIVSEDPTWVQLRPSDAARPSLSVQLETEYSPPTWPGRSDQQLMMAHLDFQVDDLELAGAHALEAGARLADYQPQDKVRVYLDPDGHPFCLFIEGG